LLIPNLDRRSQGHDRRAYMDVFTKSRYLYARASRFGISKHTSGKLSTFLNVDIGNQPKTTIKNNTVLKVKRNGLFYLLGGGFS